MKRITQFDPPNLSKKKNFDPPKFQCSHDMGTPSVGYYLRIIMLKNIADFCLKTFKNNFMLGL